MSFIWIGGFWRRLASCLGALVKLLWGSYWVLSEFFSEFFASSCRVHAALKVRWTSKSHEHRTRITWGSPHEDHHAILISFGPSCKNTDGILQISGLVRKPSPSICWWSHIGSNKLFNFSIYQFSSNQFQSDIDHEEDHREARNSFGFWTGGLWRTICNSKNSVVRKCF